jgi:hypothetical protein
MKIKIKNNINILKGRRQGVFGQTEIVSRIDFTVEICYNMN